MDKEDTHTHTHTHTFIFKMEYYLAIKKNKFKSVLVRWVNIQTITQSEVNQERSKYHKLMHIYGI